MSDSLENKSGVAAQRSMKPDLGLVPLIEALKPHARRAQLPCYMMGPFQPRGGFFGREAVLEGLYRMMQPPQDLLASLEPQPLRYAVLNGMPGIGKTETAVQFMFNRKSYYQAIFWVRAESANKLKADFANIAKMLGLENPSEPRNEMRSCELAKDWLSNPRATLDDKLDSKSQMDVPWLLIFDNADNPLILMDYVHLFRSGSVLVTSRYPFQDARDDGRQLSPRVCFHLVTFDVDEAARFLRELTPDSGQAEGSLLIAKKLGGLPLAISQMAGLIRSKNLSYIDFLERYDDPSERAELFTRIPERSQRIAYRMIYILFLVKELKDHSRLILDILSLLDPDEIPERLLDGLLQRSIIDTSRILTFGEFQTARGELLSRYLISRNENNKTLWIHHSLQDTVRSQMSLKRKQEIGAITLALIAIAWPKVPLDKKHKLDRWGLCQSLYPHILSVDALDEKGIIPLNKASELRLAELLKEAGWWQHGRGNSHAIKVLFERAYSICQKYPDEELDDLKSDLHDGLGAVAAEMNDPTSCLEHGKALLAIREEVARRNKTEDIRLAIAYNEVGIGWIMAKEYDEAIEALENAIKVYAGLAGDKGCTLALPLVNIGLAYWLLGDLDQASRVLEQGLLEREQMLSPDDTESFRTGRFLHALGNVRASQGLFIISEHFHKRALEQYLSTIGSNHHRTADICHKLAQHCKRRGDLDNALTLADQALRVWHTDKDIYEPEIARTSFLKAEILLQRGEDHEKARGLYKQATHAWKVLTGTRGLTFKSLSGEDFDELVTFWSR